MKDPFVMSVHSRLLAVSFLSLAAASAQAQHGEKQFSLRGQVVDGVSGRPLADVEIGLDGIDWQPVAEPITPDAQGRFVFNNLAAGEYILFARRPDFGTVYFDALPDPGLIQTVHINPEQTVKTVLFRVMPRSALIGPPEWNRRPRQIPDRHPPTRRLLRLRLPWWRKQWCRNRCARRWASRFCVPRRATLLRPNLFPGRERFPARPPSTLTGTAVRDQSDPPRRIYRFFAGASAQSSTRNRDRHPPGS